jgi:urease accessory protein
MRSTSTRLLIAALASIVPGVAWAHVGVGETSGFAHGFFHPITGIDHVLAMVAVGMFAANLGGRALWAVPFVETGIAVSVIVLGAAVALRWKWPVVGAMALVGVFAIFHGHAHGAEMPVDASGLEYAAGFMIATALLHVAGIGIGLGLTKVGQQYAPRLAQAGGGGMALAGIGLLAGLV